MTLIKSKKSAFIMKICVPFFRNEQPCHKLNLWVILLPFTHTFFTFSEYSWCMKNYTKLLMRLTAVSFIIIGCNSPPELSTVETAVSPTLTSIPDAEPETAVSLPIDLESIQTYTVKPANIDPAISQRPGEHIAYINPAIPPRNQLVVILPGTGATPDLYAQFGTTAAGVGFHTVGLVYENRGSISSRCKNSDDEQCAEYARLEIINGTDLSDQVDVNQSNSIENRLLRLLQYLHTQQPTEGWNQYFEGDTIKWERIILVGHSQGGGHVGLLARDHVVARVIFFNSPSDFSELSGTTADWIRDDSVTAAENYYAFFHQDDGGAKRVQVYQDLGMASFGEPVNVDENSPPYAQSHMLFTEIPSENPHVAVIGDPLLPLDDEGVSRYQDVWIYLLTGQEN